MKTSYVVRLLMVLLVLGLGGRVPKAQNSSATLTNAAVVKLVKAGFKEKTIISIITARPANFDLTTDRMIELKRNGVSERIILAMISRQEGLELADDSWAEDPFFNQETDPKRKEQPRAQVPGDEGRTDIFGSSGGVKAETQSRGGNGLITDDTITTGSATVRIIKPPAEANTPAKLDRTPTLTNASIIELVEAGFSEGTIIRRIEQSPVEFDLSPDQLTELRKRRVSTKLVEAMHSAMGVESSGAKNPAGSDEKTKKKND